MKRSIKEIAALSSERLNEENVESLAKTVWLELQLNKKYASLDELIKLIRQMEAKKENKKIAEIVTPMELTTDEQANVVKRIEDRIKSTISPLFKVDSSILGGIKIRIEDELLDLSWMGKLQIIRAKLEGNHE